MVTRKVLDEWINGNLEGHTEKEYIQLVRYFETAADYDYDKARELIDELITE